MWVWIIYQMLSVSDHNLQIPVVFGCFWMFLGHIGLKLDPDPDRSRPKDLTGVPSLLSPRHGKQYSLLEPLGCNRICHTDRVCKRGFLYVSMRISGTKHDAKLRRLTHTHTYIYIYMYDMYVYNPKNHPDFRWLHLFWMGNGPMAKAICGKLRSPSEVPEVPPSACQEQLQPLRFWFVLGLAEARAHQKPRKSSRPVLQWTISRKFMTIPAASMRFCFPPCQLSIFILSTEHRPKFDSNV